MWATWDCKLIEVAAAQIDVAVNAPEAGTIKEFLANEEDTVTVGQDLVRIELGGPPAGGSGKPAASEAKDDAKVEEKSSSPEDKEPAEPQRESVPPKEEQGKPAPPPDSQSEAVPSQKQSSQQPSKQAQSPGTTQGLGSRGERKVSPSPHPKCWWLLPNPKCRSR